AGNASTAHDRAAAGARPAVPTRRAAPADAAHGVLTAHVPARPVPTVVVPAVVVAAIGILRLFNDADPFERGLARPADRHAAGRSAQEAYDGKSSRYPDASQYLGHVVLPICRGREAEADLGHGGENSLRRFAPAGQRRLDRAHIRAGIERLAREENRSAI